MLSAITRWRQLGHVQNGRQNRCLRPAEDQESITTTTLRRLCGRRRELSSARGGGVETGVRPDPVADGGCTSASLVNTGQHVPQQTGGEELYTDDDEEHREDEEWVAILDRPGLEPEIGDVPPDKAPRQRRQESQGSKDVHRGGHETHHESDGQEIEQTVEEPSRTELGAPEAAGMVLNRKLADAVTRPVGDGGKIAVELAVQIRQGVLGHLSSIGLESAVEVVKADTGHRGSHQVEHTGGNRLAQGIVPLLLPAAHQVAVFRPKHRQEIGNLLGIECAEHADSSNPWLPLSMHVLFKSHHVDNSLPDARCR